MRRRILMLSVAVIALANAFVASGVSPYSELEGKAQRFFDHGEWASASAMFDLMLEERPDEASTYGQAIVSNAMRADTIAQMRLMKGALDHHIPFDSVFSQVREWSFRMGKSHLYEGFLKETRSSYPWMKRTIDGHLLKYYAFRRNGEQMIAYSETMLDGAPDNVGFLHTLADGYMLTGNEEDGIAVYERIAGLDPENYDALTALGNWYAQQTGLGSLEAYQHNGNRAEAKATAAKAIGYLQRAYACRPTPYVAELIKRLSLVAK